MAVIDGSEEFDQLEGVPAARMCRQVVGHGEIVETFVTAVQSGRLHHAWLLGGARGIGKASLAYLCARYLLTPEAERVDDEDLTFSSVTDAQIAGRAHPNLLALQRPFDAKTKKFKTQITVEEVRRTVSFFGKTAGQGAQRVCIVDGAEDMNASAANALLKILEEPPANTVFFVVSHNPGRLLPTILSRCRPVRLSPLSDAETDQVVRGILAEEQSDLARAVALSHGAPRRALELLSADMIGLISQIEAVLKRPGDGAGRVKLADVLGARGNDQAYLFGLQYIFDWLAGQIRARATGNEVSASRVAHWTRVWEKVNAQRSDAERYNLDKKQTILAVLDELAQVAMK